MIGLRSLFRYLCPTSTALYVALTGSDANPGTAGAPFATIQAAVNAAVPGTRIVVTDAGPYGYVDVYGVAGTAPGWITIESGGDGFRPVIDVTASVRSDTNPVLNGTYNDGIDVQLSSYIGIYGLEVRSSETIPDPNPSGICVFRGSHHVRIWNNDIHSFPGGGVNCFYAPAQVSNGFLLPAGGWDLADVSFNRIHETSKYSPFNTSGISFYGAQDLTGTTWDGRYGYRAAGNYIYDVICTVPYTPGGFDYVTDGNGISCDSLYTANNLNPDIPVYVKPGLVCGNVVAGCGGRGLHVYNTVNVDDTCNTYAGNLRTVSPAITGGVEADAQYDTPPGVPNGVAHSANLILPLNTPNSTDSVSAYAGNVILGGTQAVPAGNTDARAAGGAYFAGNLTAGSVVSALPASDFVPVSPNMLERPGGVPYQALGNGYRGVLTAAGAVDPVRPPRYAVI